MRFTSLVTITAFYFAGLIQALPIQSRDISSLNGATYTARNSDGSCQSAGQVLASVKLMKASGISNIRTYAQECNQLPNILNAIESVGGGMTVLAAVWIDGTSNDDKEISTLKSVLSSTSNLGAIRGILVGNEVLFNGIMSSSELVNKVNKVKAIAKGIQVGSVEVDSTYSSDLVSASEIVCANIHPYFSSVSINDALDNVSTRYNNFKKIAHGKQVYITETGWPSSGSPSGDAVPSLANTQKFAAAISGSSLPYYFFEWQDSNWKSSGVESHFGLLYANGKTKFSI
ncbi:glycoside hydrolase superfamily [Gilbertella persicaria]|uniref:glycoside hydrolase superfamily n=1 Tax=Gilbertella persicaria TaxID=101096 RepID=UPI00221E98FC|nr:glycoside hydrolase superfamily [Gilbertella persicaria]KAI8081978.1 glycoside hydrolase superfamily [Gilbertella persicaria]